MQGNGGEKQSCHGLGKVMEKQVFFKAWEKSEFCTQKFKISGLNVQ